ncbi:MAG: hypothetical protein L3K26_10680 [Candidatus Hydrogenedentes bacterium]|nr:hypothetical protein [Candidatus Hydrogenedentota bacterium]
MKRLRTLTRVPEKAQDVAPEVKLTFIRDFVVATGEVTLFDEILTATIPLFINKDPSNPVPQ